MHWDIVMIAPFSAILTRLMIDANGWVVRRRALRKP